MSGYYIDFVTLDLARERRLGPPLNDPVAERRGHRQGIAVVQIQLLGDLVRGKV